MHRFKSTCLLATALLSGVFTTNVVSGDLKATGYETPAFIDVDATEVTVDEGVGQLTINILRSGDFRQTTTVDYQTTEGEASEGEDFKGTGGSIVFRPGEGFKTVVIEILADDIAEAVESFSLNLSSSDANALIMRGSVSIAIHDRITAASAEPVLQVAAAGSGNIRLSWAGNLQCSLERTTDPVSGTWEPVECSPETLGDRSHVTQASGGKLFFYRLRLP